MDDTLGKPWAVVVELLEARSKRMERGRENDSRPSSRNGENVTYTDDIAAFGLGRG